MAGLSTRSPTTRRWPGLLPAAGRPPTDAWIDAFAGHRRDHRPARQGSRCSPSAGSGGASCRRTAISTCCSSTTASRRGRATAGLGDLVSGLGRRAQARPCRAQCRGADRAGQDRSRTATALLTARHSPATTNSPARSSQVSGAGERKRRSKQWLGELQPGYASARRGAGEVAYLLEPDLKDGHGGLRDVQSLCWAQSAGGVRVGRRGRRRPQRCYDVLLDARVALHRATGRPGDVLRLEDQDAAAAPAGWPMPTTDGADRGARARTVAWIADETWGRVGRPHRWRATRGRPGGRVDQRRDRVGRRRRPGESTRPSYCRVPPPPPARGARIGRQPRPARQRRAAVARALAGRARSTSWSPCCSRVTPAISGARGARSARPVRAPPAGVGARPVEARSATPTTASRSIVTSGRRRPTPPSWSTWSAAPTCS